MITLKNGTKGTSQIGYLAKMSDRDGYFDVAGISDNVIGVISESVPPNSPCRIINEGEALIYMHKKVRVGKHIRQQEESDGAVKGTCMPSTDEKGSNVVARAIEGGRGLVRATVMLSGGLNMSFGSMYNHDTPTTVTVTTPDVWYQVPSGFVVGVVNDMVFQNAREIKVNSKGFYQITWSISFAAAAGANKNVEGSVMINGVFSPPFTAHRFLSAFQDTGAMGGTGIISLNKDDLISLAIVNETGTNDIVVNHANMSVVQVG
jgi:hypothetical protein